MTFHVKTPWFSNVSDLADIRRVWIHGRWKYVEFELSEIDWTFRVWRFILGAYWCRWSFNLWGKFCTGPLDG